MGDEDTECPTCGRDDFASSGAMKGHHKQVHGESIAQQTLICEQCGCQFTLPDSQADGRRFCSKDCMAKWQSEQTGEDSSSYKGGKTEIVCERCGEGFEVYPHRANEAKFCSDECKYGGGPVQKICGYCGAEFTVSSYREGTAKYCSKQCLREKQADNRETRICGWCGEEFSHPPGSSDPNKYCSRECAGAAKSAGATVNKQCGFCGEEFATLQSKTREYCSRDCSSKAHRRERVLIACEHCGDEFEVPPWEEDAREFCSRKCFWASNTGKNNPNWVKSLQKECDWCGVSFKTLPSEDHRFCSVGCRRDWHSETFSGDQHPRWEGGYAPYYGPNWHKQRSRARHRDQHRCQDCGMTEPEHLAEFGRKHPVHHITPIREFRDGGDLDHEVANDLDNLITLCDNCHSEWEQMAPLRPDTVQPASD